MTNEMIVTANGKLLGVSARQVDADNRAAIAEWANATLNEVAAIDDGDWVVLLKDGRYFRMSDAEMSQMPGTIHAEQ